MATPSAGDERRHTPDDLELWNESYYFDWFSEDGSIGGYARIGFYPNLGRVWYWACLVGPDRPLVIVTSDDAPLPKGEQSLEVRTDGIWADHGIDAPLEQMSISLESFALELDDPTDMYRDPRGRRVPFGFDLEFATDRAAYLWPPIQDRYEIPCSVHGTIQVGEETIGIDAWGQRDHSWGRPRDWWSIGWFWSAARLDDGTRLHAVGGIHGVGGSVADDRFGVAYVLPAGSGEFEEFSEVEIDATLGEEGIPTSVRLAFGGLRLDVEPLAWAPVALDHPDGRQARFPRGMARFAAEDGRSGLGWIELNQPPA